MKDISLGFKIKDAQPDNELLTTDVQVELVDLDVDIQVTQAFTNFSAIAKEVEYHFPCEEDTTIFNLEIKLNHGKWVQAKVKCRTAKQPAFSVVINKTSFSLDFNHEQDIYVLNLGSVKPNDMVAIRLNFLKKIQVCKSRLTLDLGYLKESLLKANNSKTGFSLSINNISEFFVLERNKDWIEGNCKDEKMCIEFIEKDKEYTKKKLNPTDQLIFTSKVKENQHGSLFVHEPTNHSFYGIHNIFDKEPPDPTYNREIKFFSYNKDDKEVDELLKKVINILKIEPRSYKKLSDDNKELVFSRAIEHHYDSKPCDLVVFTSSINFTINESTLEDFVDKHIRLFVISDFSPEKQLKKLVHETGGEVVSCNCSDKEFTEQVKIIKTAYRKIHYINSMSDIEPIYKTPIKKIIRPIDCVTNYIIYGKQIPEEDTYRINISLLIEKRLKDTEYINVFHAHDNRANYAGGALEWVNSLENIDEKIKLAILFNILIPEVMIVAEPLIPPSSVQEALPQPTFEHNEYAADALFEFYNVKMPSKLTSDSVQKYVNNCTLQINQSNKEELFDKFKRSSYKLYRKDSEYHVIRAHREFRSPIHFAAFYCSDKNIFKTEEYKNRFTYLTYSPILSSIIYSFATIVDIDILEETLYKVVCKKLNFKYTPRNNKVKLQKYKYIEEQFTKLMSEITWNDWNDWKIKHKLSNWHFWWYRRNEIVYKVIKSKNKED